MRLGLCQGVGACLTQFDQRIYYGGLGTLILRQDGRLGTHDAGRIRQRLWPIKLCKLVSDEGQRNRKGLPVIATSFDGDLCQGHQQGELVRGREISILKQILNSLQEFELLFRSRTWPSGCGTHFGDQ